VLNNDDFVLYKKKKPVHIVISPLFPVLLFIHSIMK